MRNTRSAETESYRLTREIIERELAGTHRSLAQRMAASVLHDETAAEDMVQDVLLTFLEKPQTITGSLKHFFINSVMHRAIDEYRRRKKISDTPIEDIRPIRTNRRLIEEHYETEDRIRRGIRNIEALPLKQREGLMRHIAHQLGVESKADNGRPPSVRTRGMRANSSEQGSTRLNAMRGQETLRKWDDDTVFK